MASALSKRARQDAADRASAGGPHSSGHPVFRRKINAVLHRHVRRCGLQSTLRFARRLACAV